MLTIPNKNFLFEDPELVDPIEDDDPTADVESANVGKDLGRLNDFIYKKTGVDIGQSLKNGLTKISSTADTGLYNDDSLGDRDTTQRVPYAKIGKQIKDGFINLSNQADKGLYNDDNLGVRDTTQRVPYAKLAGQIRTTLDQSHQGLHNDDSLGDRDTTQRLPYAKIGTRIKNILDQSHQGLHAEDPAEGNGAKLVTPVEAAKSIGAKLQNLKFSSSAPTPAPTPAPKPAPAPAPAAPAPNSPWYQDTWNWMTAHPGYTALGAGVPLALAGAYMWNKARKNKNAGQQA